MTIVQCPRCRDEVTVPARAQARSLVRCPLCLEQYVLGEALAEIPPSLIVLDGSGGDEEPALVEAGIAQEAKAGGEDEYRLSGGFERAFDARPAAGAGVSPARPAVKGQRPKRKERSAVAEMAKIVVGGLVGCTLAPLVLWWVFDNDTLRIGPLVAPYAPWAVPTKFHGKGAPLAGDTAASTASSQGSSTSSGAPPAAGLPTTGGTANQAQPGSGLIADLPTDVPFPGPTDPGDSLQIDDPLAVSPDVAPTSSGKTKKASSDIPPLTPTTLNPAQFNPAANAVQPPPATADKRLPAAEDFAKAVLSAADGYEKVNASADESVAMRQQLYTDMYLAASEAGRIATYLSTSDSDLVEHVETLKTLLTTIAGQPGKVNAIKSLTGLHLPKRKHDEGVLVAGVVEDFRAAGPMFECTVQAGRTELIETAIICANNPQDFCDAGDELLVVGRVVENPRKNIPGYEGDRERVVLYGYSVTVPK